MKKLALFLIAVSAWGQTTINGDRTILGKLDLSSATALIPPSMATDPSGSCTNPVTSKPFVVVSLASGRLFSCVSGNWLFSSGANGQSPTLMGAWNPTTAYSTLSVVTYLGGSWWATASNTGVTPGTDATKWVQIASAGSPGPQGTQGPQGSAGPSGSTGPAGPSGQALNARGVWSSSTAYAPLDSVSYNGTVYAAVASSTNVTPGTNTAIWNAIGAVQAVSILNGGTALQPLNSMNFATPFTAASNTGQNRVDVSCPTCEVNTNKAAANGYAGLDSSGRVPVTQGGTGANTTTGWQNTLLFQQPGTGSVTRTVGAKLGENVSVLDFGALCNGSNDDTNAINAAINYVLNTWGSGKVHIPSSGHPCLVSQPIVVQRGIRLQGEDTASSTIRAMNSFPTNTPVIYIGPPNGSLPLSFASVSNMQVDCANLAGCTAIYSNQMQEESYVDDVIITEFTKYGIDLESGGVQNSFLRDVYFFPSTATAGAAAIAIHLNAVESRFAMEKITVQGNSSTSPAVLLENYAVAAIRDIHCEAMPICVKFDTQSFGTVENAWGHGLVPTLVQFTASSNGGTLLNLYSGGSATMVDDQLRGLQVPAAKDYFVQFYSSGSTSNGLGNILTTVPDVQNIVSSFQTGFLGVGTTTFSTDGTGGSLEKTPALGLMIQKSGLANSGYPGGGLHLLGNGYSNDPSAASISAGSTTDLATFVARATSANTIAMGGGTIALTANTGLTPGNAFTPSNQLLVAPSGVTATNLISTNFTTGTETATTLNIGGMKTTTDGSGGGLLETSGLGVMLQKQGLTTPGFLGGGMHLIANGYLNDPTWGEIATGLSTDMASYTARGSSANAMVMTNGTMNLTADTNLTVGTLFNPTAQLTISPGGVQVQPRTADPGCTVATQVGKIWINTSSTPSSFNTCVNNGNGYGWTRPLTSIFGRTTSVITAQTGDYTAAQVTNAVDQTQQYTNPNWIKSLAWTKLTGVPNVYSTLESATTAQTARSILNFNAPFTIADNATNSSTDVSIAQASGSTNGFLAATDWTTFSGKASAGICGANQFASAENATGGPTCVQPTFSGIAGSLTKAIQLPTTVYTDQGNSFSAGTQNFSGAAHTMPVKSGPLASMPTSCVSGEFYYATDQQREAMKQCGSAGTFQSNVGGVISNGLIADYWMGNCDGTPGTGTTVVDCSGNGNNTSFTQFGGSPSYTNRGLNYLTAAANTPILIPAAVYNSFVTVQIYADCGIGQLNNLASGNVLISQSAHAVLWCFTAAEIPGWYTFGGLYGNWNGNLTQSMDPAIGPNLFTYVGATTGQDAMYIGPNAVQNYYNLAASAVAPGSRTGPYQIGGNSSGGQYIGTIYRVVFYNRALSTNEVAQNDTAIDQWIKQKGVNRLKYTPTTAPYTLVCVGDSIVQGQNATPACQSSVIGTSLTQTFAYYNTGLSGEYLENIVKTEAKYVTGFNPSGQNYVVLWAGTNDICGTGIFPNTTPAQTIANLAQVSSYLRANGAKVLINPMLSRVGYINAANSSCDNLAHQYNALLAAQWPQFADAFNYGLNQDPNYTATNASQNTTYFQSDQIHPTTQGQAQIAAYEAVEINALLAGMKGTTGSRGAISTITANYTAGPGDEVLLCNASAGQIYISLPSSPGLRGKVYQLKKVDSSTNPCTVVPNGSQTIDGAATVVLSTQWSKTKLESDNVNWQLVQ